jgi:hypothetical protein
LQIKEGVAKEVSQLDSLGLLKDRIAELELKLVTLESGSVRDKRTIKELEEGISEISTKTDARM